MKIVSVSLLSPVMKGDVHTSILFDFFVASFGGLSSGLEKKLKKGEKGGRGFLEVPDPDP